MGKPGGTIVQGDPRALLPCRRSQLLRPVDAEPSRRAVWRCDATSTAGESYGSVGRGDTTPSKRAYRRGNYRRGNALQGVARRGEGRLDLLHDLENHLSQLGVYARKRDDYHLGDVGKGPARTLASA